MLKRDFLVAARRVGALHGPRLRSVHAPVLPLDAVLELRGERLIQPQHVVRHFVYPDAPFRSSRRVDADAVAFPLPLDRSWLARLVVDRQRAPILEAFDAVPREGVLVAMMREQEGERLDGARLRIEAAGLVLRPRRTAVDPAKLAENARLRRLVALGRGLPFDAQLVLEYTREAIRHHVVADDLNRHLFGADDALRAAVELADAVGDVRQHFGDAAAGGLAGRASRTCARQGQNRNQDENRYP